MWNWTPNTQPVLALHRQQFVDGCTDLLFYYIFAAFSSFFCMVQFRITQSSIPCRAAMTVQSLTAIIIYLKSRKSRHTPWHPLLEPVCQTSSQFNVQISPVTPASFTESLDKRNNSSKAVFMMLFQSHMLLIFSEISFNDSYIWMSVNPVLNKDNEAMGLIQRDSSPKNLNTLLI